MRSQFRLTSRANEVGTHWSASTDRQKGLRGPANWSELSAGCGVATLKRLGTHGKLNRSCSATDQQPAIVDILNEGLLSLRDHNAFSRYTFRKPRAQLTLSL